MKMKKMIALLAATMMTLVAGNAFAGFASTNQELYRVIYDSSAATTFEQVSDLGALYGTSGLTTVTTNTVAGPAFTTTGYNTAIAGGASMKIAYFAFDAATSSIYVAQTGETSAPSVNPLNWGANGTSLKTVANAYKTAAGSSSFIAQLLKSNTSSFVSKEGLTGKFGTYFTTANGSLNAIALATLSNSAISNLYFFNGDAGATGTKVLSLTTDNSTGLTTIQANASTPATPIPAAAYLLGSGLLGLFGIRRKNTKA
jgi:hypothetical protein